MSLYFVDIKDGDLVSVDSTGTETDDFETARCQAVEALPEIVRGLSKTGESRKLTATVRDKDGATLYAATLTFEGRRLTGDRARPSVHEAV